MPFAGVAAKAQERQLIPSGVSEEMEKCLQESFLESLYFAEMDDRHNRIPRPTRRLSGGSLVILTQAIELGQTSFSGLRAMMRRFTGLHGSQSRVNQPS